MLTTACLLATLSAAAADSPLLSGSPAGPGPPSLETSHAALRQLQQQSQRTGTTVVSNPLELLSAITAGAAHLEIREHMDLTDLVPFDATASDSAGSDEEGRPAAEAPTPGTEAGGVFSALNYLLGTVPPTLKSIQGNCSSELPWRIERSMTGAPMLPLRPRQCVIVADQPILAVQAPLWISRMSLRACDTGRGSSVTFLCVTPTPAAALWVTDSSLQGGGVSASTAVSIEGRAHFLDCTVANFTDVSSVLLSSGATSSVALERVTVTGNAVTAPLSGVFQGAAGTAIRVHNCTFTGNSALYDFVDLTGTSQFFADDGELRLFYGDANGEFARIQPLAATPEGRFLQSGGGEQLLGDPVGLDANGPVVGPSLAPLAPLSADEPPKPRSHPGLPRQSGITRPAPPPTAAADAPEPTAEGPAARGSQEGHGAEGVAEGGAASPAGDTPGEKKHKKHKKRKDASVSTSMQALLGLLALSGLLTVTVAVIGVMLYQRRRGMRGVPVKGDSAVFARRRPKEPVIPASSSSAHIYTSLLAADAVSACLSNSARMSSMQSIGPEATTSRLAPARTGSPPLIYPPPLPAPPPPEHRWKSYSRASDPGTLAERGRGRPWGSTGPSSDELIAAEAAAAAKAARAHLRGACADVGAAAACRGSPRCVQSLPIFTTTNAIYEPDEELEPYTVSPESDDQHPDLLPSDLCAPFELLRQHRQDSHGSRASWGAARYVPTLPPPPEPRRAARRAPEAGFPKAPPPPRSRPGVSAESGATPCTASGVGDTSYDVTVRASLPARAGVRARLDFIEYQLDAFGAGRPVLGEYVMPGPGPGNRFKGGQAVVQLIRQQRTHREYVMKSFASLATFAAEARLYSDASSPLGAFLPQAKAIVENTDGEFRDPHGHRMPPCIVMEKGESLDMWCRRAEPDRPLVYAVLVHVAKRLADLHAAGYAHRDLKPANVMWLPRENRWTLIDFGCAARIGDSAPLGFTLAYAAPETVGAWRAGETQEVAAPALDAWALGAMAVQLLAGEPLFEAGGNLRDAVSDQIMGHRGAQLPWEGGPRADRILGSLGIFSAAILGLLRRDPAARLSVSAFCSTCRAALSGTACQPLPAGHQSAPTPEPG